MLGEERRQRILHVLSRQGAVSVTGLSRNLGCSEATLRRDLQRMAQGRLLRRTHGGAVVESAHTESEPSPRDKAVLHEAEKRAIGRAAARLVTPGDVVFLNGGTTTVHVARAFRGIAGLHVVTNSISVAAELVDEDMEVTVIGGTLRKSFALSGPIADQALHALYVGTAFIGVDGISLQSGLTGYNLMESQTGRIVIERAERVMVTADYTKLGKVTTTVIAPCQAISALITDAAAPPDYLDKLRAAGIEVIIAL